MTYCTKYYDSLAESALLVEHRTKEYATTGLLRINTLHSNCLASGWLHTMFIRQLLDSVEAPLWVYLPRLTHSSLTASQVSFYQLSKGLLSRCYDDLPPPTQQWFAELLLPWLSKDLLSLTFSPISTQQGNSVKGWPSLLHKLSKDFPSLPK